MKKHLWREYFSFTRRERIGILALVFLIVAVAILPVFFRTPSFPNDPKAKAEWEKGVALLQRMQQDSSRAQVSTKQATRRDSTWKRDFDQHDLFTFDPNTLTAEGWKKLGVKEKTVATILHYIEKGGRFSEPSDIAKIYGLSPRMVQSLMPYVRIAPAKGNEQTFHKADRNYPEVERKNYSGRSDYHSIEICTADTNAWQALPGIGSKLSARIVHFREKLGGFYSVEQVGETFGLPDSTFQKIKRLLLCSQPVLTKIDINVADAATMSKHPYISWPVANSVVRYRQEHGNFAAVEDVKKVQAMTEEVFVKLRPYLSTGQE